MESLVTSQHKTYKQMCYKRLLPALFFLSTVVFSQTEKDLNILKDFHTIPNIIYKTVGKDTLDMTLFVPKSNKPEKTPVMLYTHGGGWGKGDKYKMFRAPFLHSLKLLLDNGIAVAAIEYRLTRRGISDGVDCVTDCKDAARFLIKQADNYNLNTDRMGVWGGSAGGHLSLMTGLADNSLFPGAPELASFHPDFKCIASYYPLVSFVHPELNIGSNFEKPERFIPILGGLVTEKKETAVLLSPVSHLKADSPPTLLLHGTDDTILPYVHSEYFLELAKQKKADVQLLTVEKGGHSFNGKAITPSMTDINEKAAAFIIDRLRK